MSPPSVGCAAVRAIRTLVDPQKAVAARTTTSASLVSSYSCRRLAGSSLSRREAYPACQQFDLPRLPCLATRCSARSYKFLSRAMAGSPSHLVTGMNLERSLRHLHTTKAAARDDTPVKQSAHHDHREAHEHSHGASGSHSHSVFSLHSHSHDEMHSHDAEKIVAALEGRGDRGSQITLIGLYSNVVLTIAKGAAGWYMHSAALLADAGHSLSDLMGDFVTLVCWKLSRKPPSERYPYGFAKFETLGTTTVSLLLIGGALGIGFHSYHLLIEALSHSVSTLPAGPFHDAIQYITSAASHVPVIGHSHGHVDVLDPHAAWFAGISILAKEWLYRITKTVADEERSPVLYANALHHRSDAYSSIVALLAILGTWFFPALPLDPIGGLVVSIVIFRQGLSLFGGAFSELTDAGISSETNHALAHALESLIISPEASSSLNGDHPDIPRLIAVHHIRAKRAGSIMSVDVIADVPASLTVRAISELEEKITQTLKHTRKEISEVRVRFNPIDDEFVQ